MNQNGYTCLVCLHRYQMRLRLDKKKRPMLQCYSCGTIIFARLGEIGILSALATMRLLDREGVAALVRGEAYEAAAEPGALAAVLAACAPAYASLAPAPETAASEAPLAAAGGARR